MKKKTLLLFTVLLMTSTLTNELAKADTITQNVTFEWNSTLIINATDIILVINDTAYAYPNAPYTYQQGRYYSIPMDISNYSILYVFNATPNCAPTLNCSCDFNTTYVFNQSIQNLTLLYNDSRIIDKLNFFEAHTCPDVVKLVNDTFIPIIGERTRIELMYEECKAQESYYLVEIDEAKRNSSNIDTQRQYEQRMSKFYLIACAICIILICGMLFLLFQDKHDIPR